MTLHMSGTWSYHANRQQYAQEIVEGCGTSSRLDVLTGNWVPLGATRCSCGSDNRGATQGLNIYLTACISKNNHLTSPLSLCSCLWSFKNPSLDKSIIIILEYTSSNHVKLLDHLSDPLEPLINCISSGISSGASSQLVNSYFICIHVHGFSICIPSFCKKGESLKLNTGF